MMMMMMMICFPNISVFTVFLKLVNFYFNVIAFFFFLWEVTHNLKDKSQWDAEVCQNIIFFIIILQYFDISAYKITQKLPGGGKNQQQCDFDRKPDHNKVCSFDVKKLQPCTSEMGYGYNKSSPCFFIKLNKVSLLAALEV